MFQIARDLGAASSVGRGDDAATNAAIGTGGADHGRAKSTTTSP
jgi:hypothetical protein